MAWVFIGAGHRAQAWVDEYEIGLPVLVDEDGDFSGGGAWFVGQDEGHAWAGNPRHYVIDGEGVLRYGATTPDTPALLSAIEGLLE
ncbi:MAG: hypothetical protein H6740_27630 [Alphaproteobacteria bacterium]|nr:hypothetical protein [Alphaproteobacteria bacterium]